MALQKQGQSSRRSKKLVRRGWGTSFRGQRRAQRGADRPDLSPKLTKKKMVKTEMEINKKVTVCESVFINH